MNHMKDSIMINEIVNQDIKNTAKMLKVQRRRWKLLMKQRNTKSNKCNIL